MAKMDFTFWWGRFKLATKQWVVEVLQYFVKREELDKRLEEYVKRAELLQRLEDYVTLEDLNKNNEHYDEIIEEVKQLIKDLDGKLDKDIEELGNEVNILANRVSKNEDNIKTNTDAIDLNKENIVRLGQVTDDLITRLKQAKLWNQRGLWTPEDTYMIGDVVGNDRDKILYVSMIDNNKGNEPTKDSSIWIAVSGVQSIDLDDYYDKAQIDVYLGKVQAAINALDTRIKSNTNAISALDSKVNLKADKTELNNYVTIGTAQTVSGSKVFTGQNSFNAFTSFGEQANFAKGFNVQGTGAYQGHCIHVTNIGDAKNNDGSPWSGFLWGEGANQPMTLQGYSGLNIVTPNGITLNGATRLRHDTEHSLEVGLSNGQKVYICDDANVKNDWDLATAGFVRRNGIKYKDVRLNIFGWKDTIKHSSLFYSYSMYCTDFKSATGIDTSRVVGYHIVQSSSAYMVYGAFITLSFATNSQNVGAYMVGYSPNKRSGDNYNSIQDNAYLRIYYY